MTFEQLVEEVKMKVKDGSADLISKVPEYVNLAYKQVAMESGLPSLRTVAVVTTVLGQYWLNLPTGFTGILLYTGTTEGKLEVVDGGIVALLELQPDLTEAGDLEYLALEGSVLYYSRIPDTETNIILVYRAFPAEMVNSTDTPTHIPDIYQYGTLVNKACSLLYDKIEDGAEDGKRPNKYNADRDYAVGLAELQSWVARTKSNVSRSVWSS